MSTPIIAVDIRKKDHLFMYGSMADITTHNFLRFYRV